MRIMRDVIGLFVDTLRQRLGSVGASTGPVQPPITVRMTTEWLRGGHQGGGYVTHAELDDCRLDVYRFGVWYYVDVVDAGSLADVGVKGKVIRYLRLNDHLVMTPNQLRARLMSTPDGIARMRAIDERIDSRVRHLEG